MSRRKIIARLPDMLKYNAQIKKIVYFFFVVRKYYVTLQKVC